MVRAVVRGGVLVPLGPLPPEWTEGTELALEAVEHPPSPEEEIADWERELEEATAQLRPGNADRLEAALCEADAAAKEAVRREMGLP
jgi:hypothetical protein